MVMIRPWSGLDHGRDQIMDEIQRRSRFDHGRDLEVEWKWNGKGMEGKWIRNGLETD